MKITKKRVLWNKGKKLMPLSKEHKKNISIALLSFWKLHPDFVRNLKSVHKGLTYEEEYGKQKANMIKEKIKKNHWSKTMVSPRKGLKLEKQVGFDKMNNDSKNLISLCHNCHSQTNYGREEWTSYFQNRILEEAQ